MEENLIWIDLEMTGLDPARDSIIEIATVITDSNLNILEQGPIIAVQCEAAILAGMDEWNSTQHARSGLLERVRNSRYSTADAERITLEFVRRWVPAGFSPMCGNSICQDRRFMARLMPDLERHFHYRNLDVSSVKILANRWAPQADQFQKEAAHLALDDVLDSIAELRFYRERFFKF